MLFQAQALHHIRRFSVTTQIEGGRVWFNNPKPLHRPFSFTSKSHSQLRHANTELYCSLCLRVGVCISDVDFVEHQHAQRTYCFVSRS